MSDVASTITSPSSESNPVESCVIYCASSSKVDEKYFKAAVTVGRICAENKISIKYGGGNSGLMGTIAKTCMEHSGHVIGVIPKFMIDKNWGMEKNFISEMIVTETMHERKQKMVENVDVCIALPGGVGTFEELLEIITWKKLGLFLKPIIIVNINNYYDPLIQLMRNAVNDNFMSEVHLKMFTVIDDPNNLIDAIRNSPSWSSSHINHVAELL